MADNYGIPNPNNANLTELASTDEGLRAITCWIDHSTNDFEGSVGVRISSIFVVLLVSTAFTIFPVLATRIKKLRIPLYVYLFARYFGAGVIVATAFIHLLQPAYEEIGPASCVGMTVGWREYAWPPAIALASSMIVFLIEFITERYVEQKYGLSQGAAASGVQTNFKGEQPAADDEHNVESTAAFESESLLEKKERVAEFSFRQQISAFLILEFGIIFHSVIIGLTLGTAAPDEFSVLYPVIVFHQSFEGLGIGARLSAIPFPKRLSWMPWWLVAGYGITTPVAIAAGLGVRTTYNAGSFTANVVSGVLDSISAGILLYTGFVELLARDFLFNPERTNDNRQLAFMLFSVFLGAAIMALLGKWA